MSALTVELSRIPLTGLAVRLRGEPEQLFPDGDAEFVVVRPCVLEGELTKIEERVVFRGKLSTLLQMTCSRCLERFRFPLQLAIREVIFLPTGQEEGTQRGFLSEEGALDIYYYQENRIDFRDLMHDQICLGIPLKPLCAETCQGLCTHCGQNLNQGRCECKEEYSDPRFAILKKLQRS
jgi:uncharacterized protein